jgi:CheY-like chemotaxis protein
VGRNRSVLIVDDEEGICETLRDVFEDQGFAVGIATDGAEALQLLRTLPETPGVVILDLTLPVVDGTEVYRVMQEDARLAAIPVLIATSDPSRAPENVPVLRKPIVLESLVDMVRQIVSVEPGSSRT